MSELSNQLRSVKTKISRIPAELMKRDSKLKLNALCDSLIDIFDNFNTMDPKTFNNKFAKVLNTILEILRIKETEVMKFQNEIEPLVAEAKRLQKSGNNQQIAWTTVNCIANGSGLVAVFVPGLNIPLITIGIVGSIIGIWGRIKSENEIKEEFDNIMKKVKENKSYELISFSSLVKKKQKEFEERRDELISNFGCTMNDANTVVMVEMIVDCLSNFTFIQGSSTQAIGAEVTANMFSIIKSSLKVFFDRYGKHVFNMADDAFEVTTSSFQFIATSVVIITFAVNGLQMYEGIKDRKEKVKKIKEIYKVLEDGKNSLQFFINKLLELKLVIVNNQMMSLQESDEQKDKEIEDMRIELEKHRRAFAFIFQHMAVNNGFAQEIMEGASNLQSIDFMERENHNENNFD